MSIETINPATGETLAGYDETTDREIDALLGRAQSVSADWGSRPVSDRAEVLRAFARDLRARSEALAVLATSEMGKPIRESLAEVEKCAWTFEVFARDGPRMLEPTAIDTGAVESYVSYAPLGVLFAIMPWNFPYWQVVRALAPALMAGNAVVLKHAPSTAGAALALAGVARAAGVPEGVFSVVLAGFDRTPGVSDRIISDPRVQAVTLTGSTGAGRAVAAIAGRELKKSVLELGGSDPFVVLADADLDAAAAWAVRSRFQNAGQSCIATKRLIVEDAVAERFMEKMLARVDELRLGDPSETTTTVGPMARRDLRDLVADQVQRSVDAGARLVRGGRIPDRPGFYYEPTVLDHVTPEMAVLREEVFGPVLPVVRAADADSAVALANATEFGLGSNVWTSDLERGKSIARRVAAGHTAINGMTSSDPRLPFGGIKSSGYGRELSSLGLHEFVNVHTVVVNRSEGPGGVETASE
ncbi:NAD-dependent succinate-semialdehyde dehydrogenase [Patulibacter sp. NPDC049589]|uniref:NAD-dependent succinate-semialdehyde dehydrogenase n=1 Tax=Patulibacter sp. NPDC049589 TaxID=3154731 RepID=UPI00342353AB